MSSILRALKKLEEEAPAVDGPAWKGSLPSRHAEATRRRRWLLPVGVVALLVAGGALWVAQRPAGDVAEAPKVARVEGRRPPKAVAPPRVEPVKERQTAEESVVPERPAGSEGSVEKPEGEPPVLAPRRPTPPKGLPVATLPARPIPAAAPATPVVPPAPPTAAGAAKAVAARGAERPTPPAPAPQPPVAAVPPHPAATPAAPVVVPPPALPPRPAASAARPAPPRLHDTDITLQAVAWSPDPERRMAVVNGQMVYEGSAINDYTVVSIEENGVIVEKGGRRSLLTYGH